MGYTIIVNIKEHTFRSDQRVEVSNELPVILGGYEHPYKGAQENVDKNEIAHFNI